MNNQPLQTLKGFRDIFPQEKRQRDWVLSKIIEVLQLFAFEPMETPTLEYADLLLGKYGAEADKLVYTFTDQGERQLGLRYDQTVPTARILAQYRNNLPKFFRRYQTQNVFRAEKPQKGRFREFTQCDLDIFGTQDSVADAEILACIFQAFSNIGFKDIKIKLNDRGQLVETLTPYATTKVNIFSIIQTLDKIDKISAEAMIAELTKKGLMVEKTQQILTDLKDVKPGSKLQKIMSQAQALGVPTNNLEFSPTLARGLDYYTGMICEVSVPAYGAGSLGGGGRYDNLIEDLGGVKMPAVGFAFGFDRTVEAAITVNLIPEFQNSSQVLVTLFSEETLAESLKIANQLRQADISVELYPTLDKLGKQFKLANQKNIPWTIVIGEEEQQKSQLALKNMDSGEQQQLPVEQAIELLSNSQKNE
jgi:histidyl-tRNA synthetase